MRHKIKGRKLNRTSAHRKAMLSNMSVSLIMHEQIRTTLPKAKELRPFVERMLTIAKKGTLSSRKHLISVIKDKKAVDKLMSSLSARYETRNGGYTRIIKSGFRYGDMAPIAYIEFVNRDLNAKGSSFVVEMQSNVGVE